MSHPDPFSPGGVTFRPVSGDLVTVRLITAAFWLLLPLLALAALAIWVDAWFWTGVALVLAVAGWLAWLIPRQVRAIGYAESDDDLVIRRGIMFRDMTIVPYGRMQFVDVHQGPLDRKFGISRVQLHTASAGTDATLHGLPADEASRLRDRLTARGEARLAGL